MDPVTHGVIGLALSAFSGDPVTLVNPISIGCAIGAMAPDIDIIAKIKGDYVYLKHHRGISHSVPALVGLAGIITVAMMPFFQDFDFYRVFFWTFIGCLSHTSFDILNSYGAKLFMPFTKKKSMVGIIMLYDPVISIQSLLLIFIKQKSLMFYFMIVITFTGYLISRLLMKNYANHIVNKFYEQEQEIVAVNILPALMAFHKWDFIVCTTDYNIVGQVNMLSGKINERKRFERPEDHIVNMFEDTKIGKYIKDFTPIYHVSCFESRDRIVLKCIDLRYYLRNNFMHHATAIYDKEQNIIESFFHPYNINKNIPVAEAK